MRVCVVFLIIIVVVVRSSFVVSYFFVCVKGKFEINDEALWPLNDERTPKS